MKISLISVIFLLFASVVNATTLSDTLQKKFKKISFPHEEIIAQILLETDIPNFKGNKIESDVLRAYDVQNAIMTTC